MLITKVRLIFKQIVILIIIVLTNKSIRIITILI